jgi:hypothetical protein
VSAECGSFGEGRGKRITYIKAILNKSHLCKKTVNSVSAFYLKACKLSHPSGIVLFPGIAAETEVASHWSPGA